MKSSLLFLVSLLFLSACGSINETVEPGRGSEKEIGPMATIYPSGNESRIDRHGLWRGMNGEQIVWEVRYTRGVPTGPYREWNEKGDLIATWPYNWDGEIEGWARWFEAGEPGFKKEILLETQPNFDAVGKNAELQTWLMNQ
jgi:hypothetical protein